MQILASIWQFITAIKNSIGNLLFLGLIAIVIIALLDSDTQTVPDRGALLLNPKGVIVEQESRADPFDEFLGGYDDDVRETLLRDLLDAIDRAASDPRIRVMVLDFAKLRGVSMSGLEDIGAAILRFRESGKPVYAYARSFNQTQYYLASHADQVFLDRDAFNPLGGVFLTGLGIYPTYFKSALDTLKVQYHIFKAGLYKGYVEPYTRDDMSDASREANLALINTLWQQFRANLSRQRSIGPERIDNYVNRYDELLATAGGNGGELAVSEGLVDALLNKQEWYDKVREHAAAEEERYAAIGFADYVSIVRPPVATLPGSDKIAVITARGTILDGEQPAGSIGDVSLIRLIRQARKDQDIKALVVRIDSPGGSASAAEEIRRELQATREAGKPVVISMAGAAASGGYWIASAGNKIFARATTMTGSIGAFLMFPTFEQSLAEVGVHSDGVGTNRLSDSLNAFRPLNPVLNNTLQISINHTYQRFLKVVADGREMPVSKVDEVAQGRVWAGVTAVELGLVDAIGSLDDAIDSASLLASLTDFDVIYLEKELSTRDQIIKEVLNSALVTIHQATGGVGRLGVLLSRVPDELTVLLTDSHQPGLFSLCVECRVAP